MESFFLCIFFSAACAFLLANGLERKTFNLLSQELDRQAIPSFKFAPISPSWNWYTGRKIVRELLYRLLPLV